MCTQTLSLDLPLHLHPLTDPLPPQSPPAFTLEPWFRLNVCRFFHVRHMATLQLCRPNISSSCPSTPTSPCHRLKILEFCARKCENHQLASVAGLRQDWPLGVGSSYLFFRFLLGEEKLGWTEILLEAASSISSNGRWVLDRVQVGAGAGVALRQLWRHLSSAQTTANNFHTTKFILSTALAAAAATDETNTTISLYSAPQQNLPGYPQQLLKAKLAPPGPGESASYSSIQC